MNCKKILMTTVMAAAALMASAQYFTVAELPNPVKYMPSAPDYRSTRFMVDNKMYFYGKQLRLNDTIRANQIIADVKYGIDGISDAFSPIVGYSIAPGVSPRIHTLLNRVLTTAGLASGNAKGYYARMRPCVRYNEQPHSYYGTGETRETLTTLKRSYAYPSSHSMTSWAAGIAAAASNPRLQDTLLARAYEYGQSRVLGGMHWQSDVSDARIMASAGMARIFTSDTFWEHLLLAREETNRINADSLGIEAPNYEDEHYFDVDNLPNPIAYLPAPPALDDATPELAYDMAQYVWGKSVRNTEVGAKAKFDVNNDMDVLVGEFAIIMGHPITAEASPALYSLVQQAVAMSDNACKKAQEHYKRQRPYDFFGEDAFTFENQAKISEVGSYPSNLACRAWTTAMMMVAMNPAKQDTLLKVGFDLGQSNVIAGVNWQSDVDAGRLVSSAVIARMLSNPNFVDQIHQAQTEYAAQSQMIFTDQDDITIDTDNGTDNSPMYTIDGRRATNDSRGILVGRKKKILQR